MHETMQGSPLPPAATLPRLRLRHYRPRRGWGSAAFDTLNVTVLTLLCFITFYPFYYVLIASLSEPVALAAHQGLMLLPQGLSFEAFGRVWQNPMVRSGFANTLFIVVGGTALNLVLTCCGAYALSRRRLMLEKPVMLMIIFTMFFTGGLVPNYLLVRDLGLLDSRWAVILPFAVSAWNLIILRSAFNAVPKDYEEAARIDGAGDLTILTQVYVPLCMPTLAVVAMFYAVAHWNGYFYSMIYLSDRELFPLQLVLREILVSSSTDSMMTGEAAGREALSTTIKYATVIVATLPVLAVYPFLQRFFAKGVLVGGIKE
ncbi:carbohydrate ABC transporter permease [Pseudoduganella dura]|nr:carbohydrate ABC transporter permease [Pseudoduganella dura]GGY02677.1 putative ABC transporter permease protein YtcP [Pseudoduganella dura]